MGKTQAVSNLSSESTQIPSVDLEVHLCSWGSENLGFEGLCLSSWLMKAYDGASQENKESEAQRRRHGNPVAQEKNLGERKGTSCWPVATGTNERVIFRDAVSTVSAIQPSC